MQPQDRDHSQRASEDIRLSHITPHSPPNAIWPPHRCGIAY